MAGGTAQTDRLQIVRTTEKLKYENYSNALLYFLFALFYFGKEFALFLIKKLK